jgi:hypothetical protein
VERAHHLAAPPCTRALQIGTSDGRVKLVGVASTEATLTSAARTATASLHTLPNTGCFLRLDVAGTLELWSIARLVCAATLAAPGADAFTACHPLPHDPYVVLGCTSGALCVAGLLDGCGEPLAPAKPAARLRMMLFAVAPDALGVPEDTPVVSVHATEGGPGGLCALVLHEWRGVTIYSLHKRAVRGCWRLAVIIAIWAFTPWLTSEKLQYDSMRCECQRLELS